MSACPRCGEAVATGQEYCLECGLRLPGRGRLGPPPTDPRRLAVPLLATAALALAGAVLAIVLTRDAGAPSAIVTATGGSLTEASPASDPKTRLAVWPRGTGGWTNVLVSVPRAEGRDAAIARATQARRRGLGRVGVLDSSAYASLHPGYWTVFAGVYATEAEAASALQRARAVQRTARTQQITP